MQSQQQATAPRPAQSAQDTPKPHARPIRYPFWFGGSASSLAACVTHPLDLVKVRLQMRTGTMPSSVLGTFQHILQADGLRGLYTGLSASLLRQLTYSTTRFGLYEELKARLTARGDGRRQQQPPQQPPLAVLAALSCGAGFAGGVAGNAADIANVRMQGDGARAPARRRRYRHALDGMARMARDEGLRSWFRGALPNGARAAAMTAGQLASYDACKAALLAHTPMADGLGTHVSASFLAGVMAATATAPIDVVKTRLMSASGQSVGIATLLRDLFAKEGVAWMFKGWVPSFLRLGPQTVCTFIFLEMHRKAYRKVEGLDDAP